MSPEDIFLFKGITERHADLDDMRILAEAGLDWQIIERECMTQEKSGRWSYMLGTRLMELRAESGIISPIIRMLMDRADMDLLTYAFESIFADGKRTFKEISQAIRERYRYSNFWTRKALRVLIKGRVIEVRREGRQHIYRMRKKAGS